MSMSEPGDVKRTTPPNYDPAPSYTVPEGQVSMSDEPLPTERFTTDSFSSGASSYSDSDSTKDVAKDQAAGVAQDAKASGRHVADTAKDEASRVASHAGDQAKGLFSQVKGEVGSQASQQQTRLAEMIRALGDELNTMITGGESTSGPATQLVGQASQRLGDVASWLEQREPGSVVQELTSYARRKPGTFLAVAAGLGLLAGRMTRGLADDARSDDAPVAGTGTAGYPGAGAGYAAGGGPGGYPAGTERPGDLTGYTGYPGTASAPLYGTPSVPEPGTGEVR